jgi:hypothetical protein
MLTTGYCVALLGGALDNRVFMSLPLLVPCPKRDAYDLERWAGSTRMRQWAAIERFLSGELHMSGHFDAIVIGSGLGGLTAGAHSMAEPGTGF